MGSAPFSLAYQSSYIAPHPQAPRIQAHLLAGDNDQDQTLPLDNPDEYGQRVPRTPNSTLVNDTEVSQSLTCTPGIIDEQVDFVDLYGRRFFLPLGVCSSIDSAREAIAKEFEVDGHQFTFWVGEFMMVTHTWNNTVKPGITVTIRSSVDSNPPPTPTVHPTLLPLTPPPTPLASSAESAHSGFPNALGPSDLWDAHGSHKLSFSGCGDRKYRFFGYSAQTSRQILRMYKKLWNSVGPGTWSDLDGKMVTGHITAVDFPKVNLGPDLAGPCKMEDVLYVLIISGVLRKTHRDGGHGLDGDEVYQYRRYPSLEHAQDGVVDMLSRGYSIVAHLLEPDRSWAIDRWLILIHPWWILIPGLWIIHELFTVLDLVLRYGFMESLLPSS